MITRYSVIVDGPNLISRAIDLKIRHEHVTNLSLHMLLGHIDKQIKQTFQMSMQSMGVDFFCSEKLPGPSNKKLDKEQYGKLLERLSNETMVSVTKVSIISPGEKGVDVAVATRLIEVAEICDIICLIASDKDYIPVLEYLKRKGKYIVTVGVRRKHPIELINLSNLFIDIKEKLFKQMTGRAETAYLLDTFEENQGT